ncbi:unnamed protein product [Meloidogyne enterolobii]|uniref:Uncharacterized protein n=1 Tax=Meloidogyne enterolobii TaxID=390850 RepID=A0ACB0YKC0_MELEN
MLQSIKNFTLTKLYDKIKLPNDEFQQWITDLGMLHRKRTCDCGKEMRKEKRGQNGRWICINIKKLLLAIQDLLVNPNLEDPLQTDACQIYIQNRQDYNRRVREQAQRYSREVVQLEMLNY